MTRIKGEPRTRNESERKLRAAIHRLRTPEAVRDFLRSLPAAERLPTLRLLREHANS